MSKAILSGAAILAFVGSAQAGISAYVGKDPGFQPKDCAIFDDTGLANGGVVPSPVDTHGMRFRAVANNAPNGFWGYAFPGGDGTASLYFNGGASDVLGITKLDATNFDTLEFQVGAGFGGPNLFLWVQTFLGGVPTGNNFDIDTTYGSYVGITGGGFDEIRVGGYNDAASRDAHNPNNFQALAVDNVCYGLIPAPGAAALLGVGGLVATRRRR